MKTSQLKGKGSRPASTPNKPDLRRLCEKDKDTHFSYNMTVLIGCSAEVTTRSGEKYEGIFVAYSSTQEIMLEAAHLITNENDESAISTHYDVLIIPSDKLMAMKFENAVLSYATREFQTDAAISSNRNTNVTNKELTPWDGGDSEALLDLDLGDAKNGTNGWAPGEMFKKNAEKYGVVSSYDQLLPGYTTSLDKTDSETFKKHEEQASQIADEIEKNTISVERSTADNGEDEEEKFSAVIRDSSYSNLNNNNNTVTSGNEIGGKYVPPFQRRNQNSQPPNPQPPNSNSNSSAQQQQQPPHQQSTGGNPRKSSYGGGGPRNSYASSANNFYQQQDTRRNFDRRGPPPPQYGSGGHGDGGGNRLGRGGKVSMDRRGPPRDDTGPGKKDGMEFHTSYNLSSENPPNRRPIVSVPPNASQQSTMNNVSGPSRQHSLEHRGSGSNGMPNNPHSGNPRNNNNNQRGEREKGVAPSPSGSDTVVPNPKVEKQKTPPPQNIAVPLPVPILDAPIRVIESTEHHSEEKNAVLTAASSETRVINEKGDGKSVDLIDSKTKPFTFNVNAKEFNPTAKSFTPRSPATPPRPPSTPASTPQLIPTGPQGHPYLQMSQGAIYLAPQQFSQTISPGPNQSLSGNNMPPQRHMNPHRKNIGVSQREIQTSAIPVQPGPLLAQGSLQNSGPHPPYTYSIPHQHGFPQQVRIHPPTHVVPMYNPEGGGDGNQVHMPLHFIHPASTGGHPSNTSVANVSGQNVLSGSPHGYTQSGGGHAPQQQHFAYPFVGIPVGYNTHGPTPLIAPRYPYD